MAIKLPPFVMSVNLGQQPYTVNVQFTEAISGKDLAGVVSASAGMDFHCLRFGRWIVFGESSFDEPGCNVRILDSAGSELLLTLAMYKTVQIQYFQWIPSEFLPTQAEIKAGVDIFAGKFAAVYRGALSAGKFPETKFVDYEVH